SKDPGSPGLGVFLLSVKVRVGPCSSVPPIFRPVFAIFRGPKWAAVDAMWDLVEKNGQKWVERLRSSVRQLCGTTHVSRKLSSQDRRQGTPEDPDGFPSRYRGASRAGFVRHLAQRRLREDLPAAGLGRDRGALAGGPLDRPREGAVPGAGEL